MKAIGYVRVSSDEQAREGLSIEAQTQKIHEYCHLKDLELIEICSDEGVSGFKPLEQRPGGRMVYDLLMNGSATNLVSVKLDRCFRNTGDAINKTMLFQKKGIHLHLLDVNVDTNTATGKMFFTVLAMLAQFERDIAGERTKMVLDMKKSQGKVFNHPPYGYDRLGDALIPNTSEQKNIKIIFEKKQQGASLRTIAKALMDAGIPTKKGKTNWSAATIRNILKEKRKNDRINGKDML